MSFLDSFNSIPPPPPAASSQGALPSFLDDDGDESGHIKRPAGVPSFITPETTPHRHPRGGSPHRGPGGSGFRPAPSAPLLGDLSAGGQSKNDVVVLSSAEELHFPASSLYHLPWHLYRYGILGKGSFGCATLYSNVPLIHNSQSAATTSSTFTPPPASSLAVVVKDVNLQTMMCRELEMEALQNEVRALQKVKGHPHMVQLCDYHQDDRGMMAYIITEYCEGGDVSRVLETVKTTGAYPAAQTSSPSGTQFLPEAVVASYLIQVSVALHYLHNEMAMLHRDLKPQNLFLLSDGMTIRLGDFGVAAFLDAVGGAAKETCGSPFYMAPEVCQEIAYGAAADVWSLGVLLYECMALTRPFSAATAPALTQLILKGKCTPLAQRFSPAPFSSALMDLVMSMLSVNPQGRPTIRRILRSTYVRQHLFTVPRAVLQSPHYAALFKPEELQEATRRAIFQGVEKQQSASDSGAVHHLEEYEDDFEDEE